MNMQWNHDIDLIRYMTATDKNFNVIRQTMWVCIPIQLDVQKIHEENDLLNKEDKSKIKKNRNIFQLLDQQG